MSGPIAHPCGADYPHDPHFWTSHLMIDGDGPLPSIGHDCPGVPNR